MEHTELSAELHRVGVIDIGSNSVRLVVFDGAARSPAYFYNEKVLCGLGKGISETGVLNPKGWDRAIRALERFKAVVDHIQVQSLTVVATAAVREASDGPAFCNEVKVLTGIDVSVASGLEEARLSAQGVLLGWPTAQGLVCDIGGASMELAEVSDGLVGRRETSPLGPLKLADLRSDEAKLQAKISAEIQTLRRKIDGTYGHLYLVGGSYRAIAKVHMTRKKYPLDVLHEYKMDPDDLQQTLDWIVATPFDTLNGLTSTSIERMKLVPVAARVLKELVSVFAPPVIAVSSYGLREGMLYERMPEDLRKRDPLLEACKWHERTSARFPGLGGPLADWVLQVMPLADAKLCRLVRAACLLHDVNWRADPSFRAEVCFDTAARGNLGGLDHEERIFLGLVLLHRYKNNGKSDRYNRLASVLSEEQSRVAVIVGRTIRLGAVLASGSIEVLQATRLVLKDATLELEIHPDHSALNGEVVTQRFHALTEVLDREPVQR
ncbi:MAG: Ppx/GppA family phosphatase [Rhodobacteraceae bacterium]|nr:Ppx/GppA family phosphatase [Paracoccaceae bacterium]